MDDDGAIIAGLLDSVLRWEMTDAGWHRVDEALAVLTAAIGARDPAAARSAVAALVLSGPQRTGTGLHDALTAPPRRRVPARTTDVVNRLLHRIGLPPAPEGGGSGGDRAPDTVRDDAP